MNIDLGDLDSTFVYRKVRLLFQYLVLLQFNYSGKRNDMYFDTSKTLNSLIMVNKKA